MSFVESSLLFEMFLFACFFFSTNPDIFQHHLIERNAHTEIIMNMCIKTEQGIESARRTAISTLPHVWVVSQAVHPSVNATSLTALPLAIL